MRPRTLFEKSLVSSAFAHAVFFLILKGLPLTRWISSPPVEIDLTNPILGSGPAKLGAPKRLFPSAAPGPRLPAETPLPPDKTPTAPPKDWTLPGPDTKALQKPEEPPPTPGGAEGGTGTSPLPGGTGVGADYGVPHGLGTGGAPLVSLPQLLNRDEVLANLRRFYPENERQAGREGNVLLDIHISASGRVTGTDVVESGGTFFDAAAGKVARLMRFSPAMARGGPVAVKIRQAMMFRLED